MVFVPILQNKKMSLREVQLHAQGHQASKWQYQISKLNSVPLQNLYSKTSGSQP